MTTTSERSRPSATAGQLGSTLVPAAGGALVHMLVLAPAYASDEQFAIGMWLGMLALGTLITWPVFARVVPGAGSRTAFVLGLLAAASVAVFWAAITVPLAVAAVVSARRAAERESRSAARTAGLVLTALGVAGLVTVALTMAV